MWQLQTFKKQNNVFSTGELIRPLLASAALPPLFSPLEPDQELYADGGIMNNFPSEPLKNKVDYILGSNVSIVSALEKKDLKNAIQLTGKVTGLMIYATNKQKQESCDLMFAPKALEQIGVLDRKGLKKAYDIGYKHAIELLEKTFGKPV